MLLLRDEAPPGYETSSRNQWELPSLLPHSLSSAADERGGCLEMSGFWSGRLNFKNFPGPEFVPELLGCLGVFLLLSLSSLFSLFLSLIFSRGKAHPSPGASAGGTKPFPKDH